MSRKTVRRALWAALAGSLIATPPAFARGAVFGGTTKGGKAIVLRTNPKATTLKSAVIAWSADCPDGRRFSDASEVTAAADMNEMGMPPDSGDLVVTRNRRGRFAGTQIENFAVGDSIAGVTVMVSGRMKGKRAKGTLQADVISLDAQGNEQWSCHTGTVRWTAARDRGRIFGGATSQSQPVVVRLDRAKRKVRDLVFGWGSNSCTPPESYITTTEFLGNFPVQRRRFGDTFSHEEKLDDGSRQSFAYDIAGRLSKRTASGSLHVAFNQLDPAGAQTLSCDTGAVSWRAATG
jgi:hypothetical protein